MDFSEPKNQDLQKLKSKKIYLNTLQEERDKRSFRLNYLRRTTNRPAYMGSARKMNEFDSKFSINIDDFMSSSSEDKDRDVSRIGELTDLAEMDRDSILYLYRNNTY